MPNPDLEAQADAVVVGAGMAGLSAAAALADEGFAVRLLEAAPVAGGLARSVTTEGDEVEAYYHHVFPQDRELRALINELGLADSLEWRAATTGVLNEGRVYSFDSPLDLLCFKPLPVAARLRLGAGSLVAILRRNDRRLDGVSASQAGPRWFGARGYEFLWQPLLEAKFGPYAARIAMPWLVGRMRQRANARKRGTGDRLGYLHGGLGALARAYDAQISKKGVDVIHNAPVESLVLKGDRWLVAAGGRIVSTRAVVACVSGEALTSLTTLPDEYRSMIEAIPFRGVVCALIQLDRPLGRYYWVNLVRRSELSCVAVIEHTNLVPAERYGGRHLIYLAHYVEVGSRAWDASLEQIVHAAEGALKAINPAFESGWIVKGQVSRDRWAQPVPLAGGPMPSLPIATGLPGLYHASLAHIYPDDRGVSLALKLGRRAAAETAAWLGSPSGAPRLST